MSAAKLAATFHGADTCDHGDHPHGHCVACGKVWGQEAPVLTPEQALRAHIADLLTDVDHFDGCVAQRPGDRNCSCLVGRLDRAINAEQTAIDVIARSVTEQMLGDAGQEIGDLWGDYPEIGESDWQAVVSLVMWRARSGKPDEATHREAYEHLKGRAEDGAA